MQVILNIDDNIFEEMQMHADIVEKDMSMMLSDMFTKYVANPGEIISEELRKDNCEEFEDFQMFLINFLTTTAYNNISMYKVLIRLREHAKDMHIMTDLYKTYKQHI